MENAGRRIARRNILFQSLDSGLFMAGAVFFHQMTIMVALIQKLWDSPFIIGLIPGLMMVGYNLPGIVTSRLAERKPYRKPYIGILGFFQRLFVLAMALTLLLLEPLGPKPTAMLVLLFYFSFSFFGGMYSPAWVDFCAKTIPVNYRARTNAFRSLIAGAGGIAAPFLIKYLFKTREFPSDYQASILIGFGILFCSYICYQMIKEKEPSPPVRKKTNREYFGSLGKVLRNDRNFGWFLTAQVVLSGSECGAAFFTYYAINRFAITDVTVASYALFYNISFLASGFLLGYIGDKFGNLKVLQTGAAGSFLNLLLVLIFPHPFIMNIVFLIYGISFNARLNSLQVFITEFGNDKSRIRYTALSGAIGATAYGVGPVIGGFLLQQLHVSYTFLFSLSAAAALAAFFLFTFVVKDPRHHYAPKE
ncbi:MAG: MFS transporter [Spirochaetales bacterium]|nr:MFS transporter [Spirochaetales bacterium]